MQFRSWPGSHEHYLARHHVAKLFAGFLYNRVGIALQFLDASFQFLVLEGGFFDVLLKLLIFDTLGPPFNCPIGSENDLVTNKDCKQPDADRRQNATSPAQPVPKYV